MQVGCVTDSSSEQIAALSENDLWAKVSFKYSTLRHQHGKSGCGLFTLCCFLPLPLVGRKWNSQSESRLRDENEGKKRTRFYVGAQSWDEPGKQNFIGRRVLARDYSTCILFLSKLMPINPVFFQGDYTDIPCFFTLIGSGSVIHSRSSHFLSLWISSHFPSGVAPTENLGNLI